MPTTIYWMLMCFEGWKICLAATAKGLIYVGTQNQSLIDLQDWATKHFREVEFIESKEKLIPYEQELTEYLCGERMSFNIPLDCRGTPFQQSVWELLCEIPYGQTRTYSDIASQINRPNAVRAVGAAIGANPVLIAVPCHRVIGKSGSLTGYRDGIDTKAKLLELEKKSAHITF